MTQRKWQTEDGWDVLTGWDRPLSHFFVDIERTCVKCNGNGGSGEEPNDADMCPVCNGSGSEWLFNNLDHNGPYTIHNSMGGMTIEQVKNVLEAMLTWYPPTLIGDLLQDKRNNVGNLIETYMTKGTQRQG